MGRLKPQRELLAQYLYEHRQFNKRWTDEKIAHMLGVSTRTIRNLIKQIEKQEEGK